MGFGIRRELDAFAIDVSFMNVQSQSRRSSSYYYEGSGASGSWLKLEVLRLREHNRQRDGVLGAAAPSWGGVSAFERHHVPEAAAACRAS